MIFPVHFVVWALIACISWLLWHLTGLSWISAPAIITTAFAIYSLQGWLKRGGKDLP